VSTRPYRPRRRRAPRLYLRAHLGCLGCSVPLLAVLAAIVGAVILLA
jgi:predicted metal-binding membrane protein